MRRKFFFNGHCNLVFYFLLYFIFLFNVVVVVWYIKILSCMDSLELTYLMFPNVFLCLCIAWASVYEPSHYTPHTYTCAIIFCCFHLQPLFELLINLRSNEGECKCANGRVKIVFIILFKLSSMLLVYVYTRYCRDRCRFYFVNKTFTPKFEHV
jgi:hypothetical protein